MNAKKYPPEITFYWLAFLLALGLRLFQLGAASLTDLEAGWATQALSLARGQPVTLGAQPAYLVLTTFLFSVFKDTNFLARLFPALAGSLIVWVPFYFQHWMGEGKWIRRAGVLMAFGLAIDPGLVSLSRQVGSPMPALVFSLLLLASLNHRRMVWAGFFAGVALLSGPAIIQGALILLLSWVFYRLMPKKALSLPADGEEQVSQRAPFSSASIGVAGLSFALTILFAGTLFFQIPQGLGALADTISAYLKAWLTTSGIPVFFLPGSLLVYQPLVLIFVIYGIVQAWIGQIEGVVVRQRMFALAIWALVGILLPLLYNGRQVGDMAWALIPLWALAAMTISQSLFNMADSTTRLVALCLSLLLLILAVVGWFNLLSIGRYQVNVGVYWAIIIGAFMLGLIAVLLVMAGWSSSAAKLGVIWSLCFLMGLQLFSSTWGMAIVRQNNAQELWTPPPTTSKTDLLLSTLTDLSSRNTGLRDQIEIVVLDNSPALQWGLRDFPNARFQTSLSSSESPPVVITIKGADEPQLAEKYRGQDFVWRIHVGWQGLYPASFINWLAFRQAPVESDQIILWARADLFPGGSALPEENSIP
jgi:hypothetical protein